MRYLILAAAALALPTAAAAQSNPATVTPFGLGTTTYTQNFNTLASTGTTGSVLPTGWQIVEVGGSANSTYVVGNGSSNAGGSYSFGSTGSTDRALGSIGSSGVAPIYYGGVFTNEAGGTITDLAFAYVGEQWRLSNSTDDGLTFEYQIGATGVSGGTWTAATALDFAPLFSNGTAGGTQLDGNLAANRRAISATISGLSLAAGQSFAFRWVDQNSTANDQGLAVDDFSLTATVAGAAAVPEPATWAMMIVGVGMVGGVARRRARPALA